MRGFFDPKPLQRVFDWVTFSIERSPIYSPATVNLNNITENGKIKDLNIFKNTLNLIIGRKS